MRVSALVRSVAVVALGASIAGAQTMPANLSPERAALWREIRAVNDSMQAAFDRGDMKAVAAFYLDDAQMTGGGPIVTGRAALDAYWARLGSRPGKWKLDVVEVGGSRDLAFQKGRSTISFDGDTRPAPALDFMVVWKRDKNGALRMLMDLY